MKISTRIYDALLVAMALAFFAVVAIPVQTFLSNSESFGYGLSDLLPPLIGALAVGVLTLALLAFLASFVIGRWLHILLLAAWLILYVQVTILGIGLPQIDGAFRPSIRRYLDLIETY